MRACMRVCARARPLSIVSTDKIWRLVNTQIIISVQLTVKVHTTASLYIDCQTLLTALSNTFDVCIPPKDFQHKIPLKCVNPQRLSAQISLHEVRKFSLKVKLSYARVKCAN